MTEEQAALDWKRKEAKEEFVAALDSNSWDNLQETYPAIAAALETAVKAGVGPREAFRLVVMNDHSNDLATWVRAAARHIERGLT